MLLLALCLPRAARAQGPPAGPFCASAADDDCIESVTVNGAPAAANITAVLQVDSTTGMYTLMFMNTNNASDPFELAGTGGLTASSAVNVVFRLATGAAASAIPKIAVSTGLISSWTLTPGSGSTVPAEITFTASPLATSWSKAEGCQPSPGTCAETADVDYQALLLAAFDPMPPPPGDDGTLAAFAAAYAGSFTSTTGQFNSPMPLRDPETGALSFFVGAPHFKLATGPDGDDAGSDPDPILNTTGRIRMFIVEGFITNTSVGWGVTGGAQAIVDGFASEPGDPPLTVTVGGSTAEVDVDVVKDGSNNTLGLLIEIGATTPFGYSVKEAVIAPAAEEPAPLPNMALDKTSLIFGAVNTASALADATAAQIVRLTQSGTGTVGWTASSNQPWLQVSPASGTGPADLSVSVVFASALTLSGTATGAVTLTFTGAANTAGPVNVTLTVVSPAASTGPTGAFDTPVDGSTGVAGSIAVTGWAVDDIEVVAVRILRDPVAGEGTDPVFIGNATFVEGARPDVADEFPNAPLKTRLGWGYLLLTNFLPNQGNGTFRLLAYADDAEGHSVLLGSKTITCANASATRPFGAIDTPAQGATISGTSYFNFGWVLGNGGRRADPPGGGTVNVFIDGVAIGSPSGWTNRSDVAALFPGFAGLSTAVGVFTLNPSLLTNGRHTIAWVVTDNMGGAAGVGSRYFNVAGGVSSGLTDGAGSGVAAARGGGPASAAVLEACPAPCAALAAPLDWSPVGVRRGFDLARPLRTTAPDASGRVVVHGEELDRFELVLGSAAAAPWSLSGHMRLGDGAAPLPIGSRLDAESGTFTWQPGVGFIGRYDFVFVRSYAGRPLSRQDVRIVLHPQGDNRVGPQAAIDLPGPDGDLRSGEAFRIAGWAVDLDDPTGAGVGTVHVWAYPVVNGAREAPIFLGVAEHGGLRRDVAAVFGERFGPSGYDLIAPPLTPGTYDIAVFPWSTARHAFAPAKVVRVTLR